MAQKVITDQEVFYDFAFPFAGVNLLQAFSRQLPVQAGDGKYLRTCRNAVNARGYEPGTGRLRGGSRPGLARYVAAPAVAGWLLQDLNVVVYTDAGALP